MATASSPAGAGTALAITNGVLGLLTAAIAVGFIALEFFYRPQPNPQRLAPYRRVAEQRLAKHSNAIAAEAAELAADALPPIGDAIYTQAREDYALYVRTLGEQGEVYLANVEDLFLEKVKEKYRGFLRKHRQVLAEEFPEHATPERVEALLVDFEQTLDNIVARYYLDEFRKESKRTTELWAQIEPVELPEEGEPPLSEQLAEYAADWTVLALSDEAAAQFTSQAVP